MDFYHVDLTYDNLGNIMTAKDTIHADTSGVRRFDASYAMDALSRLTRADEGNWNGSSISTRRRDERWLDGSGNLALSQTGNWSRRRLDLNGDGDFVDTNELDDTGTFNAANEWLTRDTDSNSSVNYTLTHDAVGNMTDDGKSYKYVYDAFGRLVTVKNQSNATVAEYKYNGLGHRTGWHFDADVDGNDPWVYFQYDERWRTVATWRGSDGFVREQYVYHAAGAHGLGGSSYIDSVVLRDRDPGAWTAGTADEMGERRYYRQNWRADVSVILPSTGCDASSGPGILEWVKYSAYGVPQAFSMADYNRDGVKNSSDSNGSTGDFDVDYANSDPRADVNFDGGVTIDDLLLLANAASEAAPRTVQSCASTANRIGYAGYVWDPILNANHVRHRVYLPEMGRWTRRDPAGYIDGVSLYEYAESRVLVRRDFTGQCTKVESSTGACVGSRPPIVVPPAPDVPTDEQIKNCESNTAWCMGYDPTVTSLWQELQQCSASNSRYQMPFVVCTSTTSASARGEYSCSEHTIRVNPRSGDTLSGTCESIAHEISHAIDDCRNGDLCIIRLGSPDETRNDCSKSACSEVRASNRSGECCMHGSSRRSDETYCACVARKARDSMDSLRECRGFFNVDNTMRNPSCFNPSQSECEGEARSCSAVE